MKSLMKVGDYFSATKKGKKFYGQVARDEYGDFWLENNQIGDCSNGPFAYELYVARGIKENLEFARVTNFKVLTDKRQIAVVEKSKLPRINVDFDEYKVEYKNKKFIFGCGALTLTRKEVETFLELRKKVRILEVVEENAVQDVSTDDLLTYIGLRENWKSVKKWRATYDTLLSKITGSTTLLSRGSVQSIPDEAVAALLEYANFIESQKDK